jgi:hypothetical protein
MNLNALNLGMRYQPQPDLNARLNLRRSTGQYPDYSATLGADDFTRWDVETMLSVRMSAASLVDVRLAHTNEIHSQPTAADGPKWTGSLGWQWQPTGKLSFTTRWVRDSDTSGQALGDGQINSQSKLTTHLEVGAMDRDGQDPARPVLPAEPAQSPANRVGAGRPGWTRPGPHGGFAAQLPADPGLGIGLQRLARGQKRVR